MLETFMLNPLPNTLAVIVLIALIFSWFISIILALKDTPTAFSQIWYNKLMLVFSLLGIPAILDLLQTSGFALVFAVTASLILVLNIAILILRVAKKISSNLVKDWFKRSVPILALGGLSVAGYFVFHEIKGGPVMCGPTAGCDAVQNSRYATLFGFLSMGRFGFIGYALILASWAVRQYGPASMRRLSSLSIWSFCIFGVLFSTYLTFLEPFVIGATCMWCIMSAVFMILLLLVSTPTAQQALTIYEEDEFITNHT